MIAITGKSEVFLNAVSQFDSYPSKSELIWKVLFIIMYFELIPERKFS